MSKMSRSYSSLGWLCAIVGVLAILGHLAYHENAYVIGAALTTYAFILALHIPQSYRNARAKAAQARTAPMVRPNLPQLPRAAASRRSIKG